MSLSLVIPLRTVSGMNVREHWATKATRVKRERAAVATVMKFSLNYRKFCADTSPPYEVLLTRIKPRGRALDDDNLRCSMKAVRDQVAFQLGLDDGDKDNIRFDYAEEKGPWGVRIEVTPVWVTDGAVGK